MLSFKEKPDTSKQVEKILNENVKKWFFSKFTEFSLPQLYGVLEIHSRNNILISAPTGATKTLTSFLSILNELIDSSEKGILENRTYCVYVSPLKALNNDIEKNLKEPLAEIEKIAGKKFKIRVNVRTGDTSQAERSKMLKNPPHILITTPESLAIMLTSPKFKENLRDVQWCIIDEIHALAENKRGTHLSLSMERLSFLSSHMTRIGLSATVAPLEEVAKFLVGNDRPCKIINVQFIKNMDLKVLCPVPDLIETSHEFMHHKMYELIDSLIQKHRTTLIFTNTRAATERVVHHLKDKFPSNYTEAGIEDNTPRGIGAHHGSLSKVKRKKIEDDLRKGKLKAVVCSTSLELGIDIGFIDLVICLGSPKSVARALQRIGRSGHKLKDKTKGRIIVLNRDDLVECAVLLKSAIEQKIDKVHIPSLALDVLAQQIVGMSFEKDWEEEELFYVIRKAYPYKELRWKDFDEILSYLSGEFVGLESKHVYAKIWRNKGKIGRKGVMTRVIYMTNIGTIPDQTGVVVKIGDQIIGTIDEFFLERLKPGDIFVLGGDVYEFKFSRGMTAQVKASVNRPPTVPSWVSETLPLTFDLAMEISRFRRLMFDRFKAKEKEEQIKQFIEEYLYVDKNGIDAIYKYFEEQYKYVKLIPNDKLILVERYEDERGKKIIFHSLFGRRVNDCISRAVGFAISRTQHRDVEIGINDNGFYIGYDQKADAMRAFSAIQVKDFYKLMSDAIEKSETFKRRFRHCAARALMILTNYKGKKKGVGRQQVSSMILISALKQINPDFSLLKEAKREVLEDLMDINNTKLILERIEKGDIKIKEIETSIPTPFGFGLALQGIVEVLKIEEKQEFLRRMHQMLMLKLSLKR